MFIIMLLKMIIKAILYAENLQITERVLYDNLLRKPIHELLNHSSRNQMVASRTMAVSLAAVLREEVISWMFVTSNRYITVKRSSGCSTVIYFEGQVILLGEVKCFVMLLLCAESHEKILFWGCYQLNS